MKASEHLFELIRSLQPNEKGYFKKNSVFHVLGEQNNYVKLFDAIDKQKEYDEDALLKKFKGERFTNNFAVAKSYLYNLILETLEAYHTKTLYAELQSYILRIRILLDKGLFDQCEKLIRKARTIATEQGASWFLAELARLELEVGRKVSYAGKTGDDIKNIFIQLNEAIDSYRETNAYLELITSLNLHNSSGQTRSKEQIDAVKQLMHHPLLKKDTKTLPFESQYYYYQCYFHFFNLSGDFTSAYKYLKEALTVMDFEHHGEDENLHRYASLLNNLIFCQLELKKDEEVLPTIQKMKAIRPASDRLKNELFYWSSNRELAFLIRTGRFEEGLALINHIFSSQRDQYAAISYKQSELILNYQVAYVYFGMNDFVNAKKYLGRILNDTQDNVRSDIHCFARIFNLIIHFELESEELPEHLVSSTYRYLYKKNRAYEVENIVLHFIRKELPKLNSRKEMTDAFTGLHNRFLKLARHPFEKNAFNYFNFIPWLESKITGKSFGEIVRKK